MLNRWMSRVRRAVMAAGLASAWVRASISRIRRSPRHQPAPAANASLASRLIRAASTARICRSLASGGRRAGNRGPAARMPAGVSQHHAGPGPIRPD